MSKRCKMCHQLLSVPAPDGCMVVHGEPTKPARCDRGPAPASPLPFAGTLDCVLDGDGDVLLKLKQLCRPAGKCIRDIDYVVHACNNFLTRCDELDAAVAESERLQAQVTAIREIVGEHLKWLQQSGYFAAALELRAATAVILEGGGDEKIG